MKPKILLAVDNSLASTRAVEFIGEILRDCEAGEITLYHVIAIPPRFFRGHTEPLKGGRKAEDLLKEEQAWKERCRREFEEKIFLPGKKALHKKGIREEMMPIRGKLATYASPDIALVIVHEIRAEGYCAVVLGRRKKTMLREAIFGGIASKVDHYVENCALWIVESDVRSGGSSGFTRRHKRYCGQCRRSDVCPILQSYQRFLDTA